jgi:tryptophan-rich sensory protein
MKSFIRIVLSIALPLGLGAVGGFFTSSSVTGWYGSLKKPSFNPPSWVFGPAWTVLYILMGIAFFLIWKSNNTLKNKAISFYLLQLLFNFAWTFIFFYAQQPGWALVEILILWILIIATISCFFKISPLAGWLLIPYICWVTFATILNFAIWKLN